MLLWDYVNSLWRKPRCDANGRTDCIIEKGSITPGQASGATQVAKSSTVTNGTTVLHTVTAGKTLHLVSWVVSGVSTFAGTQSITFFITNVADATQYIIVYEYLANTTKTRLSGCFPIPLTIAAGWKVKLAASAAGVTIRGFISGYEI